MLLGVLSDTHGQRQRTALATQVLRQAGAQALVHCGDVGDGGVLEELAGWQAWVVVGNTDSPSPPLVREARSLGITVSGAAPLRIELDGHTLAVFHGHEAAFAELLDAVARTGQVPATFGRCDYVLHGHTHVARDVQVGPLRVINPGALHRAARPTVATLEVQTGHVQFWPLGSEKQR